MVADSPPLPLPLACPQCQGSLLLGAVPPGAETECPHCRARLLVALFDPPAPQSDFRSGESAAAGEATCFFHPEKKADGVCDRCGRFMCALCEIDLGARRICPTCLGSGLESEKLPELINSRVDWAHLALLTGALPLIAFFLWPFFILSGPTAIFLTIFGWNKAGSLVRGKRRPIAVLGAVLGLAQLAVFCGFVYFIWIGQNG